MPPTSASARTVHWLWPPLLLLGAVTALIAWMLVALALGRMAGWMALLVALEVNWMLRLGTLRAGTLRSVVAVSTTMAIAIGANWGIASAQLGGSLGLDPWTSALKMGPMLAWTLLQLATSGVDLACYAGALVLAWWLSR
ncbi:hypothetical protein [Xanthomonas maliensis]|uniref:hypothetical protein n=1 Tax=Xanthomonas maliensis TaxID=1321368 RepID=UPI0003B45F18|nr:hypothetical protein [Xanthomonas maliensis]KAB7765171.1 hypothetical protein CKY51_15985 [Xanthomonas maliensis]